MNNYQIKFLKYEKLYNLCYNIVLTWQKSVKAKDVDLYRNIIDPFSAIFDASFHNISLTEWLQFEKIRQIQKTFQNEIGSFHQKLLGSIEGWENLETGGVVDVINKERKIIAEVKNKFNTTKGNHKIAIYDDLNNLLENKYYGYSAYYVSIISKKIINKPFTPSDNKTKEKRLQNLNIIEIDGNSFYEIVTGDRNAIYQIYQVIPAILSDILKNDSEKIISDPLFEKIFNQAFVKNK